MAVVLLVAAAIAVTVSVWYLGASSKGSATGGIPSLVQGRFGRSWVSQGFKIIIVSWQIVSQASDFSTARSQRIPRQIPNEDLDDLFGLLSQTFPSVGALVPRALGVLGSTESLLPLVRDDFCLTRAPAFLVLRRYVSIVTPDGMTRQGPTLAKQRSFIPPRDPDYIVSPVGNGIIFVQYFNSLLLSGDY